MSGTNIEDSLQFISSCHQLFGTVKLTRWEIDVGFVEYIYRYSYVEHSAIAGIRGFKINIEL